MDEERRVLVKTNGSKQLSTAQLHYFSESEIRRGHAKRQALLAAQLNILAPDIVFLQEVGGAEFNQPKTCADFLKSNTALDLKLRLPNYQVHPACRGNVGWWSDENTFRNFSVVSETTQKLIVERDANPYPEGILIEGLGILTSSEIRVIKHLKEKLVINSKNETFFFQMLKFSLSQNSDGKWWVAVNIHGNYNLRNFEEAVTTRRYLSNFINQQADKDNFQGFIVAGDFNADLPQKEASTLPWSFFHAWQTPEGVKNLLSRQNPSESGMRIDTAVAKLFDWFSWPRHERDGSLNEVSLNSPCILAPVFLNPYCQMNQKIDHIFVSDKMKVKGYSALFKHHNWIDLKQTVSDHPAIIATLEL